MEKCNEKHYIRREASPFYKCIRFFFHFRPIWKSNIGISHMLWNEIQVYSFKKHYLRSIKMFNNFIFWNTLVQYLLFNLHETWIALARLCRGHWRVVSHFVNKRYFNTRRWSGYHKHRLKVWQDRVVKSKYWTYTWSQ